MLINAEKDTAIKLLETATRLFAQHGYDGVSVRDICREAETNANAVHYHFQSKEKLLETIILQFNEHMMASAKRVLQSPPRDASEFRTRLHIFLEELMNILLANQSLLMITHTEFIQGCRHFDQNLMETMMEYPNFLIDYFNKAKESGILRESVDPEIVADLIMKSSVLVVMSCPMQKQQALTDPQFKTVDNPEFRRHWIEQNIEILLGGIVQN